MIEEQALCRIHRMGQTKEVRTVKFRIKNSFEERIADIQQDKKDLAAWAFSDEERAEAADGATRLTVCLASCFNAMILVACMLTAF
jgi:SWI/SNF-related matrix-associated actin-dependent regulator of chromatin subfamily A3